MSETDVLIGLLGLVAFGLVALWALMMRVERLEQRVRDLEAKS